MVGAFDSLRGALYEHMFQSTAVVRYCVLMVTNVSLKYAAEKVR